MELLCEINLDSEVTPNQNIRGWVHNLTVSALEEIAALGFDLEPRGTGVRSYTACKVAAAPESDQIQQIRAILSAIGLLEHTKHTIIPVDLRSTHYAFKYVRNFDKADLDQAEYLRLGVGGVGYIASRADTIGDDFVVRVDGKQKSKIGVGCLEPVLVPYASEDGRAELDAHAFRGLVFKPAVFDTPDKVKKPLFRMVSSVTLPPCLLPLQNRDGQRPNDARECGQYWDDGGHVPPILKFSGDDLRNLGDFDFATTREVVGEFPKFYRPEYIVSQRFRQAIIAGKHRWIGFTPVEIL